MPKLLLATNNSGKLRELAELLSGVPFEMVGPVDIGLNLKVAETGRTYSANARIKGLAFAEASGLLTLADDSGLEVDALGGAPGVMSSRYAGPRATDADHVAFLLQKLKGVPWYKRGASFKCVIAVITPAGAERLATGSCRGVIAEHPKGAHGFGYDPIFFFPKLNKTMAELPPEIKNTLSHRARAASRARDILLEMANPKL
jgi:XTP/dITP diphosphohydrolase